ncbi:MAG: cysteine hydrolase family protein [Chloroflexota bacterium]
MKEALLIIDIQNDYFQGGANPLECADTAAQNAGKLIRSFRERGAPVVHIQHVSNRPGSTFFLPGTTGADIHELVKPSEGERIFEKHTPNCFYSTGLDAYLKEMGITGLTVCGMMTHMCVDAGVRAAKDLGYSCTLVSDACATKDLVFDGVAVPANFVQRSFMAALNGFYAKVVKTSEIV